MRIEIHLIAEIGDVEHRHVMLHERERNDEGHETLVIIVDHSIQLGSLRGPKFGLEVTDQMIQDVDVLPNRCFDPQRPHEYFAVLLEQILWVEAVGLRDEPSERLVMRTAMREQSVLMDRMELDHRLPRHTIAQERAPPLIAEYSFDKVFSKDRIAQPPFLFDRNQRKLFHKRASEDPDSIPARHSVSIEDTHPFKAATR